MERRAEGAWGGERRVGAAVCCTAHWAVKRVPRRGACVCPSYAAPWYLPPRRLQLFAATLAMEAMPLLPSMEPVSKGSWGEASRASRKEGLGSRERGGEGRRVGRGAAEAATRTAARHAAGESASATMCEMCEMCESALATMCTRCRQLVAAAWRRPTALRV
jgi:hypothetical protein